jgi:putative PIN family toxin of toxin-antitoxin system
VIRAVVDTNVLFEGLTRLGSAADVVDAWADRRFLPCVSTALALEYQDVLARKLRPTRGESALMALQALLVRCEYVPIYYSYRPASRDPGDDFIVDCVLNSQAVLITYNVRDFAEASRHLGFKVLQPSEFMLALAGGSQR